MSKMWWLVLIVGGLLYPTKVLALPPILDCGWCGNSCGEIRSGTVCPMVAPPTNQSCISLSGKCVIQEKKNAGEGEVCGGIMGIMCDTGLVCKYGKTEDTRNLGKPIVADETGICVKETVVKPPCTPRPACLDGIKDAESGKMVYCNPPEGTIFCPIEIKGDANNDGKVDLVDFTIWKKEYLLGGKPEMADFNNDGEVGLVDFSIWKSSYLVNKK